MRILLPPSEAKAAGGGGASLDASGLATDPLEAGSANTGLLGAARRDVLTAIAAFCRDDPAAAAVALKIPASRAEADLGANAVVLSAPTMPALERFTGVLYAALDVATLPAPARAVADGSVLIMSGAFGLLGAAESVPDHRVAMSATVPGLGPLIPLWRAQLRAVIPSVFAGGHLVIDLRSADYAAVLSVTGPLRAQVVPVRMLTERKSGRAWVRRVISYPSKYAKGLLVRELLLAEAGGQPVRTVEDVEVAAGKAGFVVERRRAPGGQNALDIVSRDGPVRS